MSVVKKLKILNSLAQGFLVQIYNVKTLFNDLKIVPTFAHPTNTKVVKAITAKFPEIPVINDKLPGYDILSSKAAEFHTQLEPYYHTFLDVIDFKDLALKTMNEASLEVAEFKMEINPQVTEEFLNLYVALAQIILLINKLEERKTLLCAYYIVHSLTNHGLKEESFGRIIGFLKDYSVPMKKLWEDFKPFGPKVVQALLSIFPNFIKSKTPVVLRKEGTLSITLAPSKLTLPINTQIHNEILRGSKTILWYTFAFLLSPEEMGGAGVMDQVKFILPETLNVALMRDETLFTHKLWEELFEYKTKTFKLSKFKNVLKEGTSDSLATTGTKHKERRMYARQELGTLYNLMKDTPALIAPKLQLILAAFATAKEEVLWFFRHNPPPKVKVIPAHYEDNNISELLHIMVHFFLLIRKHKDSITSYYVEYLNGPDSSRLSELLEDQSLKKSILSETLQQLQSIATQCRNAKAGSDLSGLRDQWWAIESTLASPVKMIPVPIIAPVVEKLGYIVLHTKFVDCLEELLAEFASLRELWYFKDQLKSIFERAMSDGPEQPTHAMTYLIMLSQMIENATMFDPAEKDRIGQECIALAQDYINKVMDRIIQITNVVARDYVEFNYQISDANAIYPILEQKPDFKPTKDYHPPPKPGTESTFQQRADPKIRDLRAYKRNLWQLVSTLNEFGTIMIYNVRMSPREYLIERIKKLLKQIVGHLRYLEPTRQPFKEDPVKVIQSPSTLLKTIFVYTSVLKQFENFVDIDVGAVINEILIGQAYSPSVGTTGGKLDWISPEKPFEYLDNTIKAVAGWYSHFFDKKVMMPQLQVCYSPVRKGFWTKKGTASTFHAEDYVDLFELQKLATLIGPYGFKIMDREILRVIVGNVGALRDIMKVCAKDLEELSNSFHQEQKTGLILKNFKPFDVDNFMNRAIIVGNCLQFRRLMSEALGIVTRDTVPLIYHTVDAAFNQYERNIFLNADFVATDSLASDLGIAVGTADANLKTLLIGMAQGDVKLWDLFPAMFAICFVLSSQWRDATYNASLGGYDNNVHVISRTITDLIIAFKGITVDNADDQEIADVLRQFVEIAATLLLRVLSGTLKEKNAPKDPPSAFVFFDTFVDDCPLLTRGDLESVLPYSLLRSFWRTVYSRIKKIGEDGEEVF